MTVNVARIGITYQHTMKTQIAMEPQVASNIYGLGFLLYDMIYKNREIV